MVSDLKDARAATTNATDLKLVEKLENPVLDSIHLSTSFETRVLARSVTEFAARDIDAATYAATYMGVSEIMRELRMLISASTDVTTIIDLYATTDRKVSSDSTPTNSTLAELSVRVDSAAKN